MLINIGSKNTAPDDNFKIVIEKIIGKISLLADEPNSLLEYHNLYTSYVTLLLFTATGHRPVIDPFCYFRDFDLNEGHVLIDDKAISEKHRYRLTALSPIAIKQINEYKKHLKWMTLKLQNHDNTASIINAILQTLDSSKDKSEQDLPFLFFLEEQNKKLKSQSVSESKLNSILKELWPFEYNISRHSISTLLRETVYSTSNLTTKITIKDIEAHLGHMEQQSHPFGMFSVTSFNEHKKNIQPYLDGLLNQQGWKVISSKGNRPAKRIKATAWTHGKQAFGPVNREIERADIKNKDTDTLRNILKEYSEKDIQNQGIVNTIRESIVEKSNGKPEIINRRLNLLWRFLSISYKKNKEVKLPRNFVAFTPEPSPFEENTIENYKNAVALKVNFLDYLSNKGRLGKSNENESLDNYCRLAEIIVSAALFDGTSNLYNLELILKSTFNLTHENTISFVELKDDKGHLVYRWFPQEISLAMLYSFIDERTNYQLPNSIRKPNILAHISKLIKKMISIDVKNEECLQFLSSCSSSYGLLNTPGYLHSVITGTTYQQPIPQGALVRMQRNEKILISDSDLDNSEEIKLNDDISKLLINTTKLNTSQGASNFMEGIRLDIQEARHTSIPKGINPERVKKTKFTALVKKRINNNEVYPSIAILLANWSLKLCNDGTDLHKGEITFNTVAEYTNQVTKSIIYQLCQYQYLDLGIDEYEYIYEVALENIKHKDKTKFRNNLADFHNYLVSSGIADPINWQPFIKQVKNSKIRSYVDANFITYNEYKDALALIYKISKNNNALREYYLKCCGILICGYRFGLRISEATQIEFHNLQFDDALNELIIHITNNRHKNTKSNAGRRQIPLIEELSADEKDILQVLFSSNEMYENSSREIFSDPENASELLDISKANRIIKIILVAVTGDENIRFHHLRHSYANRLYKLLFNDENNFNYNFIELINPEDNKEVKLLRHKLTSNEELNNRILTAISSIMGHSSITTTLYNYIHISDYHHYSWIKNNSYINKHNNKNNTDYITSYIFDKPYTSTRQSRLRSKTQKIPTRDLQSSLKNLVNYNKIPQSKINTIEFNENMEIIDDIERSPRTPTLLDIDSAILLSTPSLHIDNNAIANRLHHNKSAIDSLLETFNSKQSDIMYSGYYDVNKEYPTTENTPHVNLYKETRRLRRYIKTIGNNIASLTIDNLMKVNHGLDEWAEHYHPKKYVYGIIFNDIDSISIYLDALSILDITTNHLSATIPTNIKTTSLYALEGSRRPELVINGKHRKYRFNQHISSDNLPNLSSKKKYRTNERISFTLNSKSKHDISYQKTLDRFLFVLSIYIQTKII